MDRIKDIKKEDIIAAKIEKWRGDKSMTSNRIAMLLLRDFNKTTFKPPESAEVISKLEDFQDLPGRVKNLEEVIKNITNQANAIFKETDEKFKHVQKAFEFIDKNFKETEGKFDKQIHLILKAMTDISKI